MPVLSNEKPLEHSQLKLPGVLTQEAREPHALFWAAHSLLSAKRGETENWDFIWIKDAFSGGSFSWRQNIYFSVQGNTDLPLYFTHRYRQSGAVWSQGGTCRWSLRWCWRTGTGSYAASSNIHPDLRAKEEARNVNTKFNRGMRLQRHKACLEK